MIDYIGLPFSDGTVASHVEQLTIDKATDFLGFLEASGSCVLIECLHISTSEDPFFKLGDEIIIFDTLVEVGQKPVHDIRETERIAVHFDVNDKFAPFVYALRETFPITPHENALHFAVPRSLCIYEAPYEELTLEWRSVKFLADIRNWLKLTAEGKLHQADQPLEPLLVYNEGTLIIPPDVKEDDTLFVYLLNKKNYRLSLVATHIAVDKLRPYNCYLVIVKGGPHANGVMSIAPRDLNSLHKLLKPMGLDLLRILKDKLTDLRQREEPLTKNLMILLEVPIIRDERADVVNDYYVFHSINTLEEIGISLDFFSNGPEGLGVNYFQETDDTKGQDLIIGALIPHVRLTQDIALSISGNASGLQHYEHTKFAQIGLGALGSQFFLNLARNGLGSWSLIDHDVLLPHNLVRHAATTGNLTGNFKSGIMELMANQLFSGDSFSTCLTENYLFPEQPETLNAAVSSAQVVIDISTSLAVARHLANRVDIGGKCVSIFLNPKGDNLIILAEDGKRELTLDILEHQYYRCLTKAAELNDHLLPGEGIRLSNSCRDVSSRIPQENVAMLAAVASAQFKKIIADDIPLIGIWQIHEGVFEIKAHIIRPQRPDILVIGDWTVYFDHDLLEILSIARQNKLPSETGGILIGGYDLQRKKIYIVDTILSPKDSIEYPNSYIRGTDGVEDKFAAYGLQTADHLKYVGEWHSHPDGCPTSKSNDDEILFAYIKREMEAIGYPPLMLIVGDNKHYSVYM